MKFKFKIFLSLIIVCFSFEILKIKAHNNSNGGCKDNCFSTINRKSNEGKIKFFRNNKKLITEKNSCVNNSLCRG